jgi:hypothetical protein
VGRRHPDDDRGLEPQAAAPRLAPRGRRDERAGDRQRAPARDRRCGERDPPERVDAGAVRARRPDAPRRSGTTRRVRDRAGPAQRRRPLRPPRGRRGTAGDRSVHRPSTDAPDGRLRPTGPLGRRGPGTVRADGGSGPVRRRPTVRDRGSPSPDPPSHERPPQPTDDEAVRSVPGPGDPAGARRPDAPRTRLGHRLRRRRGRGPVRRRRLDRPRPRDRAGDFRARGGGLYRRREPLRPPGGLGRAGPARAGARSSRSAVVACLGAVRATPRSRPAGGPAGDDGPGPDRAEPGAVRRPAPPIDHERLHRRRPRDRPRRRSSCRGGPFGGARGARRPPRRSVADRAARVVGAA